MNPKAERQIRAGTWRRHMIRTSVPVLLVVMSTASSFDALAQFAYRTALSPTNSLAIVRQPPPVTWREGRLSQLPTYDAKARWSFQVDLRGADVSGLELSNRLADVLHADFDDRTVWPTNLPAGFNPKRFMELGRNPGLQVRELHRRGITGKGVGIGIIDQALLVNHVEYRDRLRLYEEIHCADEGGASMHGAAVASIAVGQTVGVAPAADLYFIAETHGETSGSRTFEWDFTWVAKSIERLLEINRTLPADRKIRVFSISVGWSPGQKGCEESNAAVEKARKENVFVISTSLENTYQRAFHGLGRQPLKDPDVASNYEPGSWWREQFFGRYESFRATERLMVPMDSRCVASPTDPRHYVFYADGGWSWSVPYLAGLYTLACQVKPTVTPEEFWAAGLRTGKSITVERDGKRYEFGKIADPIALIVALTNHMANPNLENR